MQNFNVQAEQREERGKNSSRRLRAGGMIPAVVYGHGTSSTALSVNPKDLMAIIYSDSGHNTIFKLNYGKESKDVLIQDYQLDPVKGTFLHADFQVVAMDEMHIFEVPIEVKGTAEGVKVGGVLDIVLREIELECLPGDVPEHILIDVTALAIGDAIRVEDLQVDTSKIKLLSETDLVVLTITPPEAAEEEVAEEPAEPEVIQKGKAEEDEEKEK